MEKPNYTEWISFKDSPPEKDTNALACHSSGFMGVVEANYLKSENLWMSEDFKKVLHITHYIPIPPYPKD